MISRQEKICILSRQNRRRRNWEIIVPQLRQIFGDDFAESKLSIAEPKDFPEITSRTVSVRYVWDFADYAGTEYFCRAFAGEVGDAKVEVFVPQLEIGVLEIGLFSALTGAVAFCKRSVRSGSPSRRRRRSLEYQSTLITTTATMQKLPKNTNGH